MIVAFSWVLPHPQSSGRAPAGGRSPRRFCIRVGRIRILLGDGLNRVAFNDKHGL